MSNQETAGSPSDTESNADLRAEVEQLRFILDTIPQIVWSATADGTQDFANLRWYEFNGLVPGEPDPEPWRSIIHPEDVALTAKLWNHSVRTGEPYSCLHRNRRFDGEYRWVLSRAFPQRDASGFIIRWIGSGTDLTEQKVAEAELLRHQNHLEELVKERTAELQEAKETLERRVEERTAELRRSESELRRAQKMEAIGTLAAGIAHDFNNILTAILGNAHIALMTSPENTPSRTSIERIMDSTVRASDLVRQILTYSRATEQERRPVHLTPLVDEVMKLLRGSLPATIEMRSDLQAHHDTVFADPTQIHQVVMNLCTNAAYAMKDQGGILRISLHEVAGGEATLPGLPADGTGSCLKLSISDTGHGIEPEVMERIFDPYFTTKPVGDGTGMGLSVVQGIVKGHGGTIVTESTPGEGTSFHVFLPSIAANVVEMRGEPELLRHGSERILFVDDERDLASLGEEMLGALGYQVVAKTSSLDALETFSATPNDFDLVVTDLTMPGLTGMKLAQELRKIRDNIPIILCTGFNDTADSVKGYRQEGIREVLLKPYVIDTLAKTVRKVLDRPEHDAREVSA